MKIRRKDELLSFIIIVIGSFIMAIALNAFLLNNDLVVGVGGLSRIIQKRHGIPQNYVYWFLSTFILLMGSLMKKENNKDDFIFRSFTGIVCLALVFLPLTDDLTKFRLPLPEQLNFLFMPITSAIGAILLGLGIGIVMKSGGSTCGVDLISQLFEKEKSIKKSKTMRVFDLSVLVIGIITFIGKDFLDALMLESTIVYICSGLILIYLLPKVVDFIDNLRFP
ncbi:MAG: YitT family protein [Lachnospiraceae bacterium]|nr:YitT family protein [Lachnospiraceae bacterium]